jgi:hypothetical protein
LEGALPASPEAGRVTLPVPGWPGLWLRHSAAGFLAAATAGATDPVHLIAASTEAVLVTDSGERRDLGEVLELPGSVGLDAELVRLLDLEVEGDAATIARALFGREAEEATDRTLYGYVLRLGHLIQGRR